MKQIVSIFVGNVMKGQIAKQNYITVSKILRKKTRKYSIVALTNVKVCNKVPSYQFLNMHRTCLIITVG